MTVPPSVVMSVSAPLAPLQSLPGQNMTCGLTTTAPLAVEVELPPFFEATRVFVRMLLSSVAITSTFLLAALGVLMFPNRTFGPPPFFEQLREPTRSKMPASQTIVGIRYAFANEPPPEPDDWAEAKPELSSSTPRTIEQSRFIFRPPRDQLVHEP